MRLYIALNFSPSANLYILVSQCRTDILFALIKFKTVLSQCEYNVFPLKLYTICLYIFVSLKLIEK